VSAGAVGDASLEDIVEKSRHVAVADVFPKEKPFFVTNSVTEKML
jgi:hypothetical protein